MTSKSSIQVCDHHHVPVQWSRRLQFWFPQTWLTWRETIEQRPPRQWEWRWQRSTPPHIDWTTWLAQTYFSVEEKSGIRCKSLDQLDYLSYMLRQQTALRFIQQFACTHHLNGGSHGNGAKDQKCCPLGETHGTRVGWLSCFDIDVWIHGFGGKM